MTHRPEGAMPAPAGADGLPDFTGARGMQAERALLVDFLRTVAANDVPSELVLLAQLVTIHDGLQDVVFTPHWDLRPAAGHCTTLAYRVPVAGITATFAFESGYGAGVRRLAVMVDDTAKGTRQSSKWARERHLRAYGFEVMWVSGRDAEEDAAGCRCQVEAALQHLLDAAQTTSAGA